MFTHAPDGYVCPFCVFLAGKDDGVNRSSDIIYQNDFATAFVGPRWWSHNPGSVIVIPNLHYENIYMISDTALSETYRLVKKVAVAIREVYGCDGTSTRQHNEPAGDQLVWHLHVHVYPRYVNDGFYHNSGKIDTVDPKIRAQFAEKLRTYFAKHYH
ncbi:MAG TPA: HIT family protein [Patescibacteria group bacterium]|nr:HIT family protein [Patescibacteria group bacterium]